MDEQCQYKSNDIAYQFEAFKLGYLADALPTATLQQYFAHRFTHTFYVHQLDQVALLLYRNGPRVDD
jgi:hypothetical protein